MQRCSFESHGCSRLMGVCGDSGLQEHHEFPKFLGGPARGAVLLMLCPNHHLRQHALIRHLVEQGGGSDWDVLRHFTSRELKAGIIALHGWYEVGSPAVTRWNVDSAVDFSDLR